MKDVLFPLLKALARLQGTGATSREGQSMVEYAAILAFVAVLVVVSLTFLQPGVNALLNQVTNGFNR